MEATGQKHDQEKPRMDLLDPLAMEGLSRVLAFGAKKYAAHNWRGGISYSRLIAAALRHTFAILRGEDVDEESGLPHIDHLGCCWMFLSNMMKTRPDLDDRWKPNLNYAEKQYKEPDLMQYTPGSVNGVMTQPQTKYAGNVKEGCKS